MTLYARIVDTVAVDVSADPTAEFHADIAATFTSVPDDVVPQSRLVNGTWVAPSPSTPPPVVTYNQQPTPPQFLLLFTPAERVALRAAQTTDPVIDDWMAILNDQRLTMVDLTLQQTKDGIDYLVSKDLLTAERAATIKLGMII